MIDQEVEEFLAHFGVKGMHWGIRNARPTSVSVEKMAKREKKAAVFVKRSDKVQKKIDKIDSKTPRSAKAAGNLAEQKHILLKQKAHLDKNAERKRAGKLSTEQRKAAIIATGVLGLFLASHFATPTSELPHRPSNNASVEDLIRKTQDEQMYSLRRMHKEGKMDAAQFEAFSKKLNERYDRKVADALRDAMS